MNHPIDREAVQFLKDEAALKKHAAQHEEPTLEGGRAGYREGYRARGPQPIGDVPTRDISLPTGAKMRLYTPVKQTSDALVIYAHGGGFVLGCIDTYDLQSRWLVEQTGQRIISLDYRLAPEHFFPAAFDDAVAAYDHVLTESLATPDQIVLTGDSAGGCLCLATALQATNNGQTPARVVALYPVTDMTKPRGDQPLTGSMKDFATGYYLEALEMQWFREQYLPDPAMATDWRASVMFAKDLSGMPPTWIVNARADPLFDQGRDFANKLGAAGVEVTHQVHEKVLHNFMEHVSFSPSARKAAAAIVEALTLR
ncbi:MAG: alpha/beta hydrolase [Roseovarius sp.]|nr:alpha/beta hydrolase [Roseovarius sp.]